MEHNARSELARPGRLEELQTSARPQSAGPGGPRLDDQVATAAGEGPTMPFTQISRAYTGPPNPPGGTHRVRRIAGAYARRGAKGSRMIRLGAA